MFKCLALFFMTIDHIGLYLNALPDSWTFIMRILGRLAFPMFAYYFILNYFRTRNLYRYVFRLGVFALLCQTLWQGTVSFFPAHLFINVMFSFAFALIGIIGLDLCCSISGIPQRHLNFLPRALTPLEQRHLGIFLILLALDLFYLLRPDYGFSGLLLMLALFLSERYTQGQQRLLAHFFSLVLFSSVGVFCFNFHMEQYACILAFFFFPALRAERKPKYLIEKYGFYFYYPVHVAVLMILSAQG